MAITAVVPFGADVKAPVATFAMTGVRVKVGDKQQVSETTANDFTSPLTYTVVADDGSAQDFVVTVAIAKNTAKEITAFSFESKHNAALTADVHAEIHGAAITAVVPFGTNVKALVATFAKTGARVKVGDQEQVSETTANDFTSPVTYTVVADNGSAQGFVVTVSFAVTSVE